MIRDRGNIKWNSLMLPEHVKMLREWAAEDTWAERKFPDEQKLEELNERAADAMAFGKPVTITYFESHQYMQLTGRIHYFDPLTKEYRLKDAQGKVWRISLADIDQIADEE